MVDNYGFQLGTYAGLNTRYVGEMEKEEIMDLLAYILSGGKKDHEFFRK